MSSRQNDQEIVTTLIEKIGTAPKAVDYDDEGHILKLNLSGLSLSQLPTELWQLTSLQELDLSKNQLSELPPEIGQLISLQKLSLNDNHLRQVPSAIGQLTNLRELELRGSQLSELPAELWQLTSLQWLNLHSNQLSQLAPEIGQLTNLQRLSLTKNRLSQLPSEIGQLINLELLGLGGNPLSQFPPVIWQLSKLKSLMLWDIQLSQVPPEIGMLTNLQELGLNDNQLSQIPPEIGQLTNLQRLRLDNNQLSQLPPDIGQLRSLQRLDIDHNPLAQIPPELWRLTSLQELHLGGTLLNHLPAELWQMTNLQTLGLQFTQLSQLPAEIRQLTKLQDLQLRKTQLSQLPAEIGQLTNLQKLYLGETQLTTLPPEIGQLTSLQLLYLHHTQISHLPPEIGQLTSLQTLLLNKTPLSQLPPEIGQLKDLQTLDLELTRLSELPAEIGQLRNLQRLDLTGTQLRQLPPELWGLTNLQELRLDDNHLSQLPSEIGQLANLQELSLNGNHLSQLPPEIGQLANLQKLSLYQNQLSQLPPVLWGLTNLQWLDLGNNQLGAIPPEIGQLTNLQELHLSNNKLKRLPTEIGQLTNLQTLNVVDVPTLLTPPPEITARGTADILTFLQELREKSITRYEAKLLVVGEGGIGKSSLLRALRNKEFDPELSSTHGIEIDRLEFSHPEHNTVLNTWDFGGQQIYHATHQFFLTKRSLYIIVWNARLGAEQGRLHYWLETIKALAPDSPVLLVATHIDERIPDLNYQLYKDVYPQLVGNLSVSNKHGTGIAELKTTLMEQASQLPLMGQPWPQKWLDVEKTLLDRPEQHIDAETYVQCCTACGVEADIAKGTLGNYLHDLGKILYFRDDYVLSNLVVLKPNWVTKAISRVLDDEATLKAKGILLHSELPRIWSQDETGQAYESYLYPVLLRLMERFELSYQVETDKPDAHSTRSLIPQLLPYEPPLNLPDWPRAPARGQAQVEMVYRFDFVPAGIMSWFIVRTHRYTQNLHWREGVVLAYEGHQARVELNPMRRELRFVVWGPLPQNFFTILKNTVDVILNRFEGLHIRREVPCICHWQTKASERCTGFYRYEYLVRCMEAGKHEVECHESLLNVSVPELLYGIHTSTDRQVMANIEQGQREMLHSLKDLRKLNSIVEQLNQQSELIGRNFTRQWNLETNKCPTIFVLMPGSDSIFNPKNWVSQEYLLYLMCQHPPGPHTVGKGYHLRKAEEWWAAVSPWLNHLITFLKFGIPMGKAIGALYDAADLNQMQANIDLLEEITKSLPEVAGLDSMKQMGQQPEYDQQATGPALRALNSFLNEVDPNQQWGGLYKTPTPDGNILWLCDTHRQEYLVKPLHGDYAYPERRN